MNGDDDAGSLALAAYREGLAFGQRVGRGEATLEDFAESAARAAGLQREHDETRAARAAQSTAAHLLGGQLVGVWLIVGFYGRCRK